MLLWTIWASNRTLICENPGWTHKTIIKSACLWSQTEDKIQCRDPLMSANRLRVPNRRKMTFSANRGQLIRDTQLPKNQWESRINHHKLILMRLSLLLMLVLKKTTKIWLRRWKIRYKTKSNLKMTICYCQNQGRALLLQLRIMSSLNTK